MRLIGGGGMAHVFLARHRRHGGAFAVKVLADHLAQEPQIVARFEQEARTAASLSGHPNIVPIFDIGSGNGLHYLIMQYISGENLASYLSEHGKLTPADAANVIAPTAQALVWSESRRIVHRDLKPANILLDTTTSSSSTSFFRKFRKMQKWMIMIVMWSRILAGFGAVGDFGIRTTPGGRSRPRRWRHPRP